MPWWNKMPWKKIEKIYVHGSALSFTSYLVL
jgi:hypothetical protein